MKRNFSLSVFLLLLIVYVVFPRIVLASNREQVLGQDTESSVPIMSPTAEGPGLILPDSPFFILDELKQSLRLAFAVTPEAKARIHTAIAGERLAELRYMLARNNSHGIEVALSGVAGNLELAANALSQSQFSGHDVSKIALSMSVDIKAKQKILDDLESKSSGALRSQIALAQEKILSAKLTVEDSLPQDESSKELTDDLKRNVDRETKNIKASVDRLSKNLDTLNSSLNSKKSVAGASTSAGEKTKETDLKDNSEEGKNLEQTRAAIKKIQDAVNPLVE